MGEMIEIQIQSSKHQRITNRELLLGFGEHGFELLLESGAELGGVCAGEHTVVDHEIEITPHAGSGVAIQADLDDLGFLLNFLEGVPETFSLGPLRVREEGDDAGVALGEIAFAEYGHQGAEFSSRLP